MKHNGVILQKVETIQSTLRELRKLSRLTSARLEKDFFLKRGVERSLQICVEAMIDIAHRLVSLLDQPPCATGAAALEVLQDKGILKDVAVYKKMIQFRNLIVHRYEIVDSAMLVDIVKNHLVDIECFVREVSHAKD
jgi:uncharacterized protein YutE (UPF0331/DUF86 family)